MLKTWIADFDAITSAVESGDWQAAGFAASDLIKDVTESVFGPKALTAGDGTKMADVTAAAERAKAAVTVAKSPKMHASLGAGFNWQAILLQVLEAFLANAGK